MQWSKIRSRLRDFHSPKRMYIRWQARQKAAEHQERSIRMNELAGHIRSQAEAAKLIEELAEMFKETLPPFLTTQALRTKLAFAEFKSATSALDLIPEDRIAQVWNAYVREIGAPDEAAVTVTELHNLRDAAYASGTMLWEREGGQTVWSMSNIVALGEDGKVASGCRALEAVRLLYSMGRHFANVISARERARLGQLVSDELARRRKQPDGAKYTCVLKGAVDTNPVRLAKERYIQERGLGAFNDVLAASFAELLATK